MSAAKYVLWVIPDRGGGWTSRATARSLEEAETMRGRLYRELGDVTVRVLMKGEHPTRCLDVKHPSRDTPEDGAGVTPDTDLTTLRHYVREHGPVFLKDSEMPDSTRKVLAALDRVETELARLRQERDEAIEALDDLSPFPRETMFAWKRRTEAAEHKVARLREGLRRLYEDAGDLDISLAICDAKAQQVADHPDGDEWVGSYYLRCGHWHRVLRIRSQISGTLDHARALLAEDTPGKDGAA